MDTFYLVIVVFLLVLAVFDLVVGVSNDAVNFINSAIGSKVASFRTIIIVASVGVFAGAAVSNGMMDVARHGIMNPECFSFADVMCIFLAVMVTDVLLLDIFNNLGMPTSTTVSLVFELLGGTFALAVIKLSNGAANAEGELLRLGDMLNTDKAVTVVLGIFLSVAIAFFFGFIVQWISRLIFTFTYRVNGKSTKACESKPRTTFLSALKIGVFSGISITCIVWFLLVNGLKSSTLMTDSLKLFINDNSILIIGGGIVAFSLIMTILSALRVAVLKIVVLAGTFALAMAFAGNDLVNFVGVPLTGLEAYGDYKANGMGNADGFMMSSLQGDAHTPVVFLLMSGVVMVLALCFSKKAHNVVKTSVDLSRQDSGDEMFGTSAVARTLVRKTAHTHETLMMFTPDGLRNWVNSRFNQEDAHLDNGAAFDLIRASVNLVLAGILVAIGTAHKLPLSTTYVTFMVAMGTSLADRAWGRESAVFRITGVISVIGGWFITAGVAFIACALVALVMHFGGFVAMAVAIVAVIAILIRNQLKYSGQTVNNGDALFESIMKSDDKAKNWDILRRYITMNVTEVLKFIQADLQRMTDALFNEEYGKIKKSIADLEEERRQYKRVGKKEIVAHHKIDSMLAVERNSWYYLTSNSIQQMLYCIKRISEQCLEHVGNNYMPIPGEYVSAYVSYRIEAINLMTEAIATIEAGELDAETAEHLRSQVQRLQSSLSKYRDQVLDDMQTRQLNVNAMTLYLSLLQETHFMLSSFRHALRGMAQLIK